MFLKSFILVAFVVCTAQSVTVQEAKKNPLQAYVLTDQTGKVEEISGVRIGPLDLKYVTPRMLQKVNLSQELVQKFQPYFNKSGQEAQKLLQEKPLKLTQQEYDQISNNVLAHMKQRFNKLPAMVRNNPRVMKLRQLALQKDWPDFLQQSGVLLQEMGDRITPAAAAAAAAAG